MVLSPAEIAEYTALVRESFVHTYTKTQAVAGSVDTWKMAIPTYPGPAQTDLPCNYLSEGDLVTREKSVTHIDRPTISVPPEDSIAVGDRVDNVKDADGNIVLTGPLYVQDVATAMGFGSVTNRIAALFGQQPKKY